MLTEARVETLRESAIPLVDGVAGDYDVILEMADGARVVVLGISLGGSHELVCARVELTKRLIADVGFSTLCVAERSEVVQALDAYLTARTANNPVADWSIRSLAPKWTWHNVEMFDFVAWLRSTNDLFANDLHKVRVCAVNEQLRDRSVIWVDWHSLAPHSDGVGRLARKLFGRQAVLVGFTTSSGTALTDNDGEPLETILCATSPDSLEAVLERVHLPHFVLRLRDAPERVAGVFRRTPAEQMDALIHFDRSRAVEALVA